MPSAPHHFPQAPEPSQGRGARPSSPARGGDSALLDSLYADALEGALALVRADGGEIATVDSVRQVLVSRSRTARGQERMPLGSFGVPALPSQPVSPFARPPVAPHVPLPSMTPPPSRPSDPGLEDDEDEDQSTVVLPAALMQRTYQPGDGLLGQVWQQAEPIILRGEEYRARVPSAIGPASTASWHLAVPIFRPSSLAPTRAAPDVLGVIAVFNRDPLWSFSVRDAEVLALHADRIARSMDLVEMARQHRAQAELLELVRGGTQSATLREGLFTHVRDVVRLLMEAPALAVVLYNAQTNDVAFELAERDGRPMPLGRMPATALPPWWRVTQTGRTVALLTAEDRAAHPEYCLLGWGDEQAVQSLIAVPLRVGATLLGALVVASPLPEAYTAEHVRFVETVGQTASVLVENARLADDMRRSSSQNRERATQLAALNNAVLTLNASLDLNTTLTALVHQAAHLTAGRACIVLLREEGSEELVARAAHVRDGKLSMPIERVRIPLSWHTIGTVLVREPYLVLDHLEQEWNHDTPMGQLLRAEQVRTCLIVPITHQENTLSAPAVQITTRQPIDTALGMLLVFAPGERHHFQSSEIGLLNGLASQAAAAIRNARLYHQLQQAYEELKELDRLKDEFILTVSHEFRTPLTAIDGYVTLISRHGSRLEPAKLEQFGGEIRQATNQLASMISMLADANRMTSQPLLLILTPVNVRAAATEAISTQSPEAKTRIALEVSPDLWVQGDAERLKTVFSNLLSNAIKYAPDGPPYSITAHIEPREALARRGIARAQALGAASQWVVIGVRDHGAGISQEDQARLFKKFVRLTQSLTTSVRGTGLGLWICRQYLEAMGGEIWVESVLTEGAHFQFCLPIIAAPGEHALGGG